MATSIRNLAAVATDFPPSFRSKVRLASEILLDFSADRGAVRHEFFLRHDPFGDDPSPRHALAPGSLSWEHEPKRLYQCGIASIQIEREKTARSGGHRLTRK